MIAEVTSANVSFPDDLQRFIGNSGLIESSGESGAKTFYIDRDEGYFLKIADKDRLSDERLMTEYFHTKGFAAKVVCFFSDDRDYLVTEKVPGVSGHTDDCLEDPMRLSEAYGESLRMLHEADFTDCPIQNRMELLLTFVQNNAAHIQLHKTTASCLRVLDAQTAIKAICDNQHLLQSDALLHGDYCLPNIILNEFKLSGFIDLGLAGVGDRHYDLSYGIWSLQYNTKSNAYTQRFLDAYGRDKIDEERLRICGLLTALE